MRVLKDVKSLETPRESLPFHTWKVKDFSKKIVKFPNPPFQALLGNGAVADSTFTGIKMVGDAYVPAGVKSTVISLVDGNNTADTINVNSTKMPGNMGVGFGMWNFKSVLVV